MKLCFATNNAHKLSEARHVAGPHIDIVSLQEINCFEELPETTNTLEGNSLQKAEYVYTHYHLPCFSDDTGLEVEALHGEPGVDSAHYAGPQRSAEENIGLLLQKLEGKTNRAAQFRTVITLIGLTQEPLLFEGIVKGTITLAKRGTSGFGYDPVFVPEGHTVTFAEMTMSEKNTLSHRARALQKLQAFLQNHSAGR
ncbi:RdgB/HAM1 family non-canonical purine NTP pyrophosphatase [Chryseolinea lacunae]|uniref:dITP/XTP pyrophosphatase n=1 Tax=Chryseolinea lacunae TaxID=2801331 RepID=A0ABS1KVI6_9BACT|nr:RdgB/HAM1 family non-canonical purine NTP pyrophosphatase [Chryseolinea lacunae]MBL0743424.1 RdgB/HAM1 family non-canonical purine NTP pyrophosphatase [Chryseolinea lacunae]